MDLDDADVIGKPKFVQRVFKCSSPVGLDSAISGAGNLWVGRDTQICCFYVVHGVGGDYGVVCFGARAKLYDRTVFGIISRGEDRTHGLEFTSEAGGPGEYRNGLNVCLLRDQFSDDQKFIDVVCDKECLSEQAFRKLVVDGLCICNGTGGRKKKFPGNLK